MTFELNLESAPRWLAEHGLNPQKRPLVAADVSGGVSATVIAVRGDGVSVLLKQGLSRLRVADHWEASQDRTETEAAALELLYNLTPGALPRMLAHDARDHVVAMELLPPNRATGKRRSAQGALGRSSVAGPARRWGRGMQVHAGGRPSRASSIASTASRKLRLSPFHETVMERLPEVAAAVGACAQELRSIRRCLVDGDYAPKNILLAPGGRAWVFDLEVAHIGNPVFDLAFFLSFVLLSAIRWPALTGQLRELGDGFLAGYAKASGDQVAADAAGLSAHTACLMLARTDGVSPAAFLDDLARDRVRAVATRLLQDPNWGLWSWR